MRQIGDWYMGGTHQACRRDADGLCRAVTWVAAKGTCSVISYRCSAEAWARFVAAGCIWADRDAAALEFVDAVEIPRSVLDALWA